jgi:hypothetical protein
VPARRGGSASRFSTPENYPYRPSRSPSPVFSATQVSGDKARLIETIAEMAVLALPEGKTVDDLIKVIGCSKTEEACLGARFAQRFQDTCQMYGVHGRGGAAERSWEERSSAKGMSFTEAFSKDNSAELANILSGYSKNDLSKLKKQFVEKHQSSIHTTSV